MRCKLFVALQLEDLLHFTERIANEYIRRPEYPGTFGATPTLKMVMFDPYEFTQSCHLQAEDKISAHDVSFHFIFFLP
jgi:hypothetical protein